MVTYYLWRSIVIKGEVEDTRLEARPRTQKNFEAKDRPSRGQGQGHMRKCSPKKKGLQKIFFRRSSLEENKKRSSQSFREVSGVFQQNFNGSTNSAVLEPKTAIFEDLRLRSQGQGLQNLSSRPRTSSRTPPLIVILIH